MKYSKEEIRKLRDKGMSIRQIAKKVGATSPSVVQHHLSTSKKEKQRKEDYFKGYYDGIEQMVKEIKYEDSKDLKPNKNHIADAGKKISGKGCKLSAFYFGNKVIINKTYTLNGTFTEEELRDLLK